MQTKTRDFRYDALRTIGLFAIILAHVSPPPALFQLRNFDVPLMALLIGTAYALSSSKSLNYLSYLWHRFIRLYLPTAIFLVFFFLIKWGIAHSAGLAFPYASDVVWSSFDLTGGIGYVWVIRVFILVALILPPLSATYQKVGKKKFLAILLLIYLLNEILSQIYPYLHLGSYHTIDQIFKNIIFYLLPFGCVAGLGIAIKDLDRHYLKNLATFFGMIFIAIALIIFNTNGQFVPTQSFKYPPHAYYLSYALFVSTLLYLWSISQSFAKIFDNKFIAFVGASSLWIYLWQILFLKLWYLTGFGKEQPLVFLIEYIIVIVLSLATVWLQKKAVSKYIKNRSIAKIFFS